MNTIHIGDAVKILRGRERFWIEVEAVHGERVTGRVDNHLVFTSEHGLALDDRVTFDADEVLDHLPRVLT